MFVGLLKNCCVVIPTPPLPFELESCPFDQSCKRRKLENIRVRKLFVKHDSSAGANDTIKTGCASLLFRDLAKHCDESRHVETCVSKREICCISLRVSDVVQTGGSEFA